MNLKTRQFPWQLTTAYYLLALLMCLVNSSANANELWTRYQFVHLNIASPAKVNSLYEDPLGQIWVGADSGLYRIYNNEIEKVSHGPNSSVEHVIAGEQNNIWLATSNGVWFWQNHTNRFIQQSCDAETNFRQLVKHPTLGLIALASSGIYQINKGAQCQKVPIQGLPEKSQIERIAMFEQVLILAVRGYGLFQCSVPCQQAKSFAPELANTRVREITTQGETLFVGTHKHGFYSLNFQGEVQQHWHRKADTSPTDLTLPMNGVMTILPTKQKIWAGLWAGGLQEFDKNTGGKVSSSRFYAPDTSTISGRHVSALLESENGTLYVGHENGVSLIVPAHNQLDWIGLANKFKAGFIHDNIFSLNYLNNAWFTGTSSGGLYRIGSNDNELLKLSPDSPPPFNLPSKSVWKIIQSKRGDLVLGTANGVFRLNPTSLEWQKFGDARQLQSADVFGLTEAPDKTLWLSLWEGGIARLNQNGKIIGQWSQNDGLQHANSMIITSTADNSIFVLNEAGLFRFQEDQNTFIKTELRQLDKHCSEVDHISTSLAGKLWALCENKQLWQRSNGTWITAELITPEPIVHIFSPFAGNRPHPEQLYLLSQNYIMALDDRGKLLWQKPRLATFGISQMRHAGVANNHLVTATDHGIYRQAFDQTRRMIASPSPIISGIRLFNKPLQLIKPTIEKTAIQDNDALYQGSIQLEYDQDLITFEFALPGYHADPIKGFQYRLFPFDKEWIQTAEDEAKSTYTRLPPGAYRFEAKVLGQEDLPPAVFELEVLPPWYLTWWVKTLAALLFIVGVLATIIGRTKRLEQKNLQLQQKVQARTTELEIANKKLQQTADLDSLTGLLNRRGLHNLVDANWPNWQGQVMLMIADIDHFKQINDKYGHQLGDEVLITCSKRLQSQAQEHDLIARWGGEEFLIILKDDAKISTDNLLKRAQKLQSIIGDSIMELSSEKVTITMTAGICEHTGQSFDGCLQQADQKLYEGKNAGRNQLIT